MSYSDWVYEPWFTFRFASTPEGNLCGICKRAFQENDLTAIFTDGDATDLAHTACIDSLVKCECCRGMGYHSRLGRRAQFLVTGMDLTGLLGGGPSQWCKSCEGRGFNPSGLPCGSPGLPPV